MDARRLLIIAAAGVAGLYFLRSRTTTSASPAASLSGSTASGVSLGGNTPSLADLLSGMASTSSGTGGTMGSANTNVQTKPVAAPASSSATPEFALTGGMSGGSSSNQGVTFAPQPTTRDPNDPGRLTASEYAAYTKAVGLLPTGQSSGSAAAPKDPISVKPPVINVDPPVSGIANLGTGSTSGFFAQMLGGSTADKLPQNNPPQAANDGAFQASN